MLNHVVTVLILNKSVRMLVQFVKDWCGLLRHAMLKDTLYHPASIRMSRQRIHLRQLKKRNESLKIGSMRLHVANSEETIQRNGTGETFSDGHKCSHMKPSEVWEISHTNNQSGLWKFAAEGTENAYSKWLAKLKMTSVQSTYFLLREKKNKKKPTKQEDYYNIDKTAHRLSIKKRESLGSSLTTNKHDPMVASPHV